MAALRRVPVRHTNNLQTVNFHLLIDEHAHPGSRNGMQILAVIPTLLVVSRNKIHSVRRHELAQRLRCSADVDGCAVIQIAGNKNRVRLFLQNLRNHPPQKTAVSHMPQVQVADERRPPPAPRRRQVRESHRRSSDSRPACVEDSVEASQYCSAEQTLHHPMEAHLQPSQPRTSETYPGENSGQEEECQETQPNRSNPVKRAYRSICIAEGKERSGNKAYRQKAENQLDPQRPVVIASCGRNPRLIDKKMRQKKHGLQNYDEADQALLYPHDGLDSSICHSDCWHRVPEIGRKIKRPGP